MKLLMTMTAGENCSNETILNSTGCLMAFGLKILTGNFHISITLKWFVVDIPEFYHGK